MAQIRGSLPPIWETHIEFPSHHFDLALPQPSRAFGSADEDSTIYPPIYVGGYRVTSLTLGFQIHFGKYFSNKQTFKKEWLFQVEGKRLGYRSKHYWLCSFQKSVYRSQGDQMRILFRRQYPAPHSQAFYFSCFLPKSKRMKIFLQCHLVQLPALNAD